MTLWQALRLMTSSPDDDAPQSDWFAVVVVFGCFFVMAAVQ